MFFLTYLLCSYNKHFGNLMIGCPCYNDYNTDNNNAVFIENVIMKRGSYMACLCYESSKRRRIGHKSIPIMLGSYIDYRIRGREAFMATSSLWGLVILRGILKIYSNFSTFDALSMHVRETKFIKSIDWYTYIGEDGLAINYSNKVVTWTHKHKTYTNEDWVHYLQDSNPFNTPVLQSEYIHMFDNILRQPYSMNNLQNRQILNGPVVINRYVSYILNRRIKKKVAGCQKMSQAFENGTVYQALSKKNTYETEEWCRTYPQAYDNTMHEGRSNKAAHLLPNVIRASNAAVRNSNALSFPIDAVGYFCLLNTKDLKSAGEQNVLADFVIMCEETDQMALYKYITTKLMQSVIEAASSENSSLPTTTSNAKSTRNNTMNTADTGDILTINGYLINCRMVWTLDLLVMVKKQFPHVTTQYNPPYVRFSTRPNIPIKYSDQYDTFFSPAETTHFNIQYPEIDMLSVTAKELGIDSLIKTPPAKCTVSINNIKGSISTVPTEFHRKVTENSLGVTCYMLISSEEIVHMIDHAIISTGHDTSLFFKYFNALDEKFKLIKYKDKRYARTSPRKAMEALHRMYPCEHLLMECCKTTHSPYIKYREINSAIHVSQYRNIIFNSEYYPPPSIWNLKLRAAFGNPNGSCIEDGVVIDKNILPHIPPVYYNACITVEFTFRTVTHREEARFIAIDEKNGSIGQEILIGCLVTEHEVYVKNSKHTKVLRPEKIGGHYFHLINFLPKQTNMYDDLRVRHIYNNNAITVVITGQTMAYVDVGSKIANSFGQKNVISASCDLSDCWGITRDGTKVHAQIIYSEVSLVGRVTSGQLYSMFMSNELAFGENGVIIAPVDLVLHTLHPYTNIKIIKVKNDTLTNINGFDSQNLSYTSKTLRSEDVYESVIQILGLHGYDGNVFTFPQAKSIIISPEHEFFNKPIPTDRMMEFLANYVSMEYENDII